MLLFKITKGWIYLNWKNVCTKSWWPIHPLFMIFQSRLTHRLADIPRQAESPRLENGECWNSCWVLLFWSLKSKHKALCRCCGIVWELDMCTLLAVGFYGNEYEAHKAAFLFPFDRGFCKMAKIQVFVKKKKNPNICLSVYSSRCFVQSD